MASKDVSIRRNVPFPHVVSVSHIDGREMTMGELRQIRYSMEVSGSQGIIRRIDYVLGHLKDGSMVLAVMELVNLQRDLREQKESE